MSYTLAQLRKGLARELGIYINGTTQEGGDDWMIDMVRLSSRTFHDGHLDGAWLYIPDIVDAAIVEHDPQNGKVTIDHALALDIPAATPYEIFQRFSKEELDEAMLMAVEDWRLWFVTDLTTETRLHEISDPTNHLSTMDQVHRVWYVPHVGAGMEPEPLPYRAFRLLEDAGKVYLEMLDPLYSQGQIRVEYRSKYLPFTDGLFPEDSVTGGDLRAHIFNAQAFLYRRVMQSTTGQAQEWMASLYQDSLELAERFTDEENEPPGRVITHRFNHKPSPALPPVRRRRPWGRLVHKGYWK